nr:DUF3558 family protein [Corynebacterium callunae]
MLSGCVSGASSSTTVTVTESQSTSGTLAVEPATEGIFASQFDPCEVFSDERFSSLGLGRQLANSSDMQFGAMGCSFAPNDFDKFKGVFLIATDQINRDRVQESGLNPVDWNQSRIPGLYIHEMSSQARQCEAAVDYDWGRFVVDYYEVGSGWEPNVLCPEAVRILEELILGAGGSS